MLRLIGRWIVELCCLSGGSGNALDSVDQISSAASNQASERASSILSAAVSGAGDIGDPSASAAAGSSRNPPSTLGVNLAEATATFLQNLLPLIDRGFVLQRLRDLLAMLEIRHNMVGPEHYEYGYLFS